MINLRIWIWSTFFSLDVLVGKPWNGNVEILKSVLDGFVFLFVKLSNKISVITDKKAVHIFWNVYE